MSVLATGDWSALMELLAPELSGFLSQARGALEALLGPPREQPLLGSGEVDGYAGLARRGRYERLLLSEWLLAEEFPDEFMRRASSNELAFHELAKREPRVKRTLLAVLDSGPSQVGAPRLGQVAALVTLDRRARRTGATLAWVIVDQAPVIHTRVDEAAFRAFLHARSDSSPSTDAVTRALEAASSHGPFSEIFLLGGPAFRARRLEAEPTLVVVEDLFDPDRRALSFQVTRTGRKSRAALVDLPDEATAIRLLRRPISAPSSPVTGLASDVFDIGRGFTLSSNGSHLLGVSKAGDAVVLGTGGPSLDGKRLRHTRRPKEGEVFIAVGCERQADIAISQTTSGVVLYVGKHAYTCEPLPRLVPEPHLGRILRFGVGHDASFVLLADSGSYRFEGDGNRMEVTETSERLGFATLREKDGTRSRRRATLPSIVVKRQGDSVHVLVDGAPSMRTILLREAGTGRVHTHVATNESRTEACVVIRPEGSDLVHHIVISSAGRTAGFRSSRVDERLLGVLPTRTGFEMVLASDPREIVLEHLDGKRRLAFRSGGEIVHVALASCSSLAAVATRFGLITITDLDLGRIVSTARGAMP